MPVIDHEPTGVPGYKLRAARPDDAGSIAKVHIQTWLTTYRGLVSDRLLDQMPSELDARTRTWQNRLADPGKWHLVVVEGPGGGVVGFCSAGPERRANPSFTAEVGIIYLMKEHQRRGVGRALFRAAARLLKQDGHRSLLVWVLARNPSRRFYEELGGHPVEERQEEVRGETRDEVAYGWDETAFGRLSGE
ncbi:MAG: GNAT family N-acetyltransferase [Candidatus Lutacidiplasmatales archaeon]